MAGSLEQGLKVRICPICNTHNFGESILCKQCDFSLGDVDFKYLSDDGKSEAAEENNEIEAKKPESARRISDVTVVERAPALTFVSIENGKTFQAKNGAILGRTNIGGNEVFGDIDTVSRKHAQIYWDGLNWEIEALITSTNGTCVNGANLTKGKRCRIKKGDTINLSSQCSLKVLS